jgi:hypothetical protein
MLPWSNGSLTLYHGTVGPHARSIIANGIRWDCGSPETDFSLGFYTTRIRSQAIRHANHRFRELLDDYSRLGAFHPEYAVVVELSAKFDGLGGLDALAFVQPTADWETFINHCRSPSYGHKGMNRYFEVVYGPMSNALGTAIAGWEQMSFHSGYAVSTVLEVVNDSLRGTPVIT